jgi:hypothetical protein
MIGSYLLTIGMSVDYHNGRHIVSHSYPHRVDISLGDLPPKALGEPPYRPVTQSVGAVPLDEEDADEQDAFVACAKVGRHVVVVSEFYLTRHLGRGGCWEMASC